MIALIVVLIIVAIYFYFLIRSFFPRKYIVVDWTRSKMYGWYNGEILDYDNFDTSSSAEETEEIKKRLEKSLDKKIEVYKKVK